MDEDDGQLARELVPVDEAFMMKESDQGSPAQLGLEQKGQNLEPTAKKKKKAYKALQDSVIYHGFLYFTVLATPQRQCVEPGVCVCVSTELNFFCLNI